MYFVFKTLKSYVITLLILAISTCLLSSVASLILLFLHNDTFTLKDLLLAPSQLPMGQGLQKIRADIIYVRNLSPIFVCFKQFESVETI